MARRQRTSKGDACTSAASATAALQAWACKCNMQRPRGAALGPFRSPSQLTQGESAAGLGHALEPCLAPPPDPRLAHPVSLTLSHLHSSLTLSRPPPRSLSALRRARPPPLIAFLPRRRHRHHHNPPTPRTTSPPTPDTPWRKQRSVCS